jgi:hypothetical protein
MREVTKKKKEIKKKIKDEKKERYITILKDKIRK